MAFNYQNVSIGEKVYLVICNTEKWKEYASYFTKLLFRNLKI